MPDCVRYPFRKYMIDRLKNVGISHRLWEKYAVSLAHEIIKHES
jgi:hypothetical protein